MRDESGGSQITGSIPMAFALSYTADPVLPPPTMPSVMPRRGLRSLMERTASTDIMYSPTLILLHPGAEEKPIPRLASSGMST